MRSIGGYNSYDFSLDKNTIIPEYNTFQSSRAGLYLYLKVLDPSVIYLPEYLCDSLYPAIRSLGINIVEYKITKDLLPEKIPKLAHRELLLVVNYFGLLGKHIKRFSQLDIKDKLIIDNSQAFFCPVYNGVTTLYSARKFLPVADGGWIKTNIPLPKVSKIWCSEKNIAHILMRGVGLVEDGYRIFLKAEKALEDFFPSEMSLLTKEMIKHTDCELISQCRRKNFQKLDELFSNINKFDWKLDEQVPLCYPLMFDSNVENLHVTLCKNGIFTPRYWNSNYKTGNAKTIYENTVFLPIDERLRTSDLERLYLIILEAVSENEK